MVFLPWVSNEDLWHPVEVKPWKPFSLARVLLAFVGGRGVKVGLKMGILAVQSHSKKAAPGPSGPALAFPTASCSSSRSPAPCHVSSLFCIQRDSRRFCTWFVAWIDNSRVSCVLSDPAPLLVSGEGREEAAGWQVQHHLFIHSPVVGLLACFQFLVITMECYNIYLHFSGSGTPVSYRRCTFKVSKGAVPFHSPHSSLWWFQLLHSPPILAMMSLNFNHSSKCVSSWDLFLRN